MTGREAASPGARGGGKAPPPDIASGGYGRRAAFELWGLDAATPVAGPERPSAKYTIFAPGPPRFHPAGHVRAPFCAWDLEISLPGHARARFCARAPLCGVRGRTPRSEQGDAGVPEGVRPLGNDGSGMTERVRKRAYSGAEAGEYALLCVALCATTTLRERWCPGAASITLRERWRPSGRRRRRYRSRRRCSGRWNKHHPP